MDEPSAELFFSAISLWEIAVKRALNRPDFSIDPALVRRVLLDNGYRELNLTGDHALGIQSLPPLHKDPFDRCLISQATFEGITLLTSDGLILQYPGPILKV
jgi:PIN domain nuclease of toxin-antitoxin system